MTDLPLHIFVVHQDEVGESSDAVQEPKKEDQERWINPCYLVHIGATFYFDIVMATLDFSTGCHRL